MVASRRGKGGKGWAAICVWGQPVGGEAGRQTPPGGWSEKWALVGTDLPRAQNICLDESRGEGRGAEPFIRMPGQPVARAGRSASLICSVVSRREPMDSADEKV